MCQNLGTIASGSGRSHLFLTPKLGSLRFAQIYLISGNRGRKDFIKLWMSSWGHTWLSQVKKVSIFRGRGQGASVSLSEPKEVVVL